MRLTLESCMETGTIVVDGAQVPCRIWSGSTEQGNRVIAFITRLAPLSVAAALELEAALNDVTEQTTTAIDPDWETLTETGVNMDALVEGVRIEQPHTWHRLVINGQTVWIEPRPRYCNRGRYHANYEGSFFIDAADSFPRYYMDLETAKREMRAWLLHRIECERRNG